MSQGLTRQNSLTLHSFQICHFLTGLYGISGCWDQNFPLGP